jgi:hypothetical protein
MWLYFPQSHYAQDQEPSKRDLPEPATLLKFAQSCTWRGKLSPPHTWRLRFKRVEWLQLLSGAIYASFQARAWKSWSSWCLWDRSRFWPVSPVNPTAAQVSKGTRKMSDGSGQTSHGGLATLDPTSFSLRMCQGSLWEDSGKSWRPLPPAGTLRNGTVFERAKRVPRTGASGSFWSEFYPTPTASSYGSSQNEGRVPHDRPSRGIPNLETWARTGSTPAAADGEGVDSTRAGRSLRRETRHWATPTARDRKGGRPKGRQGGRDLALEAEDWPTPMATSDNRGGAPSELERRTPTLNAVARFWDPTRPDPVILRGSRSSPSGQTLSQRSQPKRRLSWAFVWWLMGWDPDGISSVSRATESSPRRPT